MVQMAPQVLVVTQESVEQMGQMAHPAIQVYLALWDKVDTQAC